MLVAENGVLVTLYPHSGHYRPTNLHLHRLLLFLRQLGVDLSCIQVDAQRVHKVARQDKTVRFSAIFGPGEGGGSAFVLLLYCLNLSLTG